MSLYMDELKRYIMDHKSLIARINAAEKLTSDKLNKYNEKQYMNMVLVLKDIIKQTGEIQIKIERLLGRKLTNYEMLNGVNI